MPFETTQGLNEQRIWLNLGVDEISCASFDPTTMGSVGIGLTANMVSIAKHLKMLNWRISKDGNRIEKRDGLTSIAGPSQSYDIMGYATYTDSNGVFWKVAVTEKAIWVCPSSTGTWTSIHTWSQDLLHPINILSINGYLFFITEFENVKLADGASSVTQVSITAPTTIPTVTATAVTVTVPQPLTELFAYANTGALNAVWANGDSGSTSVMATSGPSTQGPDAHNFYLRLHDASPSGGRFAKRSISLAGMKPKYNIELNSYFETLRSVPDAGYLQLDVYNGDTRLSLLFADGYLAYMDGSNYIAIPGYVGKQAWGNWKIIVDSSTITAATFTIYLDGTEIITKTFTCPDSTSASAVLKVYESVAADVYIDNIKITVAENTINPPTYGKRKYAVTYARGGNYGTESAPIKSVIGAVTFSGTHLNDMTVTGTYTGDETKTIRVQVDGTGTPDTIKWSEDDGATWSSQTFRITDKVYIYYGIELNFAHTTGHTATEYWSFVCAACSVVVTGEKAVLTSIPVSSDPQVNQRKIYRTTVGGETYNLLTIINDNTSTTFDDNIPDTGLGSELVDWTNIAPLGRYTCYWDGRLWIFDDTANMIYYSSVTDPEQFDISSMWISVKDGRASNIGMALAPLKEDLFAMKRHSTYRISPRLDGSYSVYCVSRELGMLAPAYTEIAGLLMFVSYRGLETFNGEYAYSPVFSADIDATFKTITAASNKYITAVHSRKTTEAFFSFPDRSTGTEITAVYNYSTNSFYFYRWHKIPSFLTECLDAGGELQVVMGTRDGLLFTVNSGTQDGTTNISATVRTRWLRLSKYHQYRHLEIEHESPDGMAVTANLYLNQQATAYWTKALSGTTPTTVDLALRLATSGEYEMFIKGKYVSLEFTNAEDVGSDMKLNYVKLFYAPMVKKNTISPD